MSDPLNHAMLLGENEPPDQRSTDEWADRAVAADCVHHEHVGANGVEYLAGRRDPTPQTDT